MKSCPGLILVLWLFLWAGTASSQVQATSSNYNSVLRNTGQFGLMFGPAIYKGDLNVGNFTLKRSTGLAASLYGQYYFSNVFGFRLSIYSGILNGGIKTYVKNNIELQESFTGIILEGDLHMIVNFSNLFFGASEKRRFFVYGTVGLGYGGWYSKLNNKVYDYDSLKYDNPLSNFNASFVIPAGLGFYYRIGNRLNLGMEYSYKTYLSDKLDNFPPGGYPYDVVHYVALNISFNLGTGLAGPRSKKVKSSKPQARDYQASYPVYAPAPTMVYTPPPEARQPEQAMPVMVYPSEKPNPVVKQKSSSGFCYSVQVCAFDRHRYSAASIKKRYHIVQEVRLEKQGKVERFMVGRCADVQCARDLKEKMQKLGIRDAFIVAYQDGRRHHSIK